MLRETPLIDISNQNEQSTDTDYLFHQKQKMMQQELEQDQEVLRQREENMAKIEGDILDVNKIMRELNQRVADQHQGIGKINCIHYFCSFKISSILIAISDTIETNVEHATADIEGGTSELQKAAEYQAKYRRKVIILLIIAVIIGLIVTGLVVSQLKSN